MPPCASTRRHARRSRRRWRATHCARCSRCGAGSGTRRCSVARILSRRTDLMNRHENTKTPNPRSSFVISCFRGLPTMVALLAIGCTAPPPDDRDYGTKIAADRAAKDAAFAAADDPISKAKHAEFLPLAYYPIDPEFNVPAGLKRIDHPTIVEMPMSTGTNRKIRRVGMLQFTLKGQPLSLLAFLEDV